MILQADSEDPDQTDCADAQADLGVLCPHVPKDTFFARPLHQIKHFTKINHGYFASKAYVVGAN